LTALERSISALVSFRRQYPGNSVREGFHGARMKKS
jgi:hypothetical protein